MSYSPDNSSSPSDLRRKPAAAALRLGVAIGLCALLTPSCAGPVEHSMSTADFANEWVQPTPQFRRKLEEQASRVPYLRSPEEMMDVIQFFVQARESAYSTLLEMASGPDPKVVGVAFAALGATRDERLAPHVRAMTLQADGGTPLQYERARCLAKLGDWVDLPVLVRGLRDESLLSRAQCLKTLREETHQSFGFHPQGSESEREEAVQAWESWLERRGYRTAH